MADFLDERGRLFGRVNIVDLIVILLILALAGLAYARLSGGSAAEVPYRLTVSVERVRSSTVEQVSSAIETGSPAHTDTNVFLGTVKSAQPTEMLLDATVLPAEPGGLVEGATVRSGVYSDITVIIEGKATKSGENWSVGGLPLRTGKQLVVVGSGFEVRTTILNVEGLPS